MSTTREDESSFRKDAADATRKRILSAAFAAFSKHGYSETSTLEIARRARVSKRELYALVGNKQEMLVACIRRRAQRLEMPPPSLAPRDRAALARELERVGVHLMREVSANAVIAVFRLAIAEAKRAPEVAQALDEMGREASRSALREIFDRARSGGLIDGNPSQAAEQFTALLWGELFTSLLLRVADPPDEKEMIRRARAAANAVMRLYA
jgi:AcrR family transcriptional regulator